MSFSVISKFEKDHFLTDNLISNLTKIFVVMYINTSVILLSMYALIDEVDIQLPNDIPFPFLQG